ncbi:MAG: hypothetical protein BRC57_12635 [Cyanobacteria bacterium QS_8_48_54]|nr:MAG: hypothetical protein BRC57_12635 [Cyanobacteria bacterium QS_8_48_54]
MKGIIKSKYFSTCTLLFVGVDWYRKGGDTAFKTAKILNEQGIKTELHVAGCVPPFDVPGFVTVHGHLSKKTEEGKKHLDRLFSESHFLILPSKAECYGVVFAEANSFGLPPLASNVGGISSVVRNGRNGQLFSLEQGAENYANYVKLLMFSQKQYQNLALSSFKRYTERINWSSAGQKVKELIWEFCC